MTMRDEIKKHFDDIDGVVFDFGGVIVRAPGEGWKILDVFEENGIDRKKALEGLWKYRGAYDGGKMGFRAMFAKIFEDNAIALPDESFYEKAFRADSEGWTDFSAETLDEMRKLRDSGKKIGILSNMSLDFFTRYFVPLASEYRKLCSSEVISSHCGIIKPDPGIYAISQREMGIDAGRLLFLDDTLANVQAARNCGWRSEVYKA